MSAATFENTTLATVHSFLKRNETSVPSCLKVVSYTHDTGSGPVLFLVHGYPQSAFIWRHVALLLKDKVTLFIPELPGYGISSFPKEKIEFASMGTPLIEACMQLFPGREIILGGHDRGARVCHRLAVENAHFPEAPKVKLLGCFLLDITPTLQQWKVFANAKASAAYFHWPFLASPIAPDMIEAYGGSKWTLAAVSRISGGNEKAAAKFKSDYAWDVYASVFGRRETIEGSCADYHAGAFVEPQLQIDDQAAGRKIEVPTVVGWSLRGLGAMHGDVGEIWQDWVKPGVSLTKVPFGDDVGHYLPEESSELAASEIIKFLQQVVKA